MKFDMHCHTAEGSLDGKVALTEYVNLLKKEGFTGMLITDHNSYKAYQYYLKNRSNPVFSDFTVLKGIEYDTLSCGHFLIVMPSDFSYPLFALRGMPLALLIRLVHKYGGIIGPAHPFGEKFLSYGRSRSYRKHPELAAHFDFVEGYNCCESAAANRAAMRLADRHDIPCFGGSDSHKADNVGYAFTEFPVPIESEDELIRYVRNKGTVTYGGRAYHGTLKNRLGKWNDVLVYSYFFYNKFTALVRFPKRRNSMQEMHADKSDGTHSDGTHS